MLKVPLEISICIGLYILICVYENIIFFLPGLALFI